MNTKIIDTKIDIKQIRQEINDIINMFGGRYHLPNTAERTIFNDRFAAEHEASKENGKVVQADLIDFGRKLSKILSEEITIKIINQLAEKHLDHFEYVFQGLMIRTENLFIIGKALGNSGYPEKAEWVGAMISDKTNLLNFARGIHSSGRPGWAAAAFSMRGDLLMELLNQIPE